MANVKKPYEREPRRRVICIESGEGNQSEVLLSCGHILYVSIFGRYAQCKTMGCPQCKREQDG